ncbi:MAG TPA: 5-oxoprolinase [Sphingobacterium sp.]|nr:5-oxoprolinase [Sphingobacterium sp.]
MATLNYLYNHLTESFNNYSTEELIELNNEIVQSNWGSSRGTFRTAILNAFAKRGIDLSHIISKNDGFTSIKSVPVRLEKNTLIPIG